MKILYFDNPVFKSDINVTIRRGVKWATVSGFVPIMESGKDKVISIANIKKVIVKRFCDLEIKDIVNEHDKECIDYDYLLKAMKKMYFGFDEKEIVSVVYFTVMIN